MLLILHTLAYLNANNNVFFNKPKWDILRKTVSLTQDVSRATTRIYIESKEYKKQFIHYKAKQSKGLDHQLWQLMANVTFVAFNLLKEKSLILSIIWEGVLALPRNNMWFFSVHTTQAHASQIRCKKERRAREPPAK
jgi:hypothetical protein